MKKFLDNIGLQYLINKINLLLNTKVDKVNGKSLSDNNYDSASKAKVDNIPANPKYTDTTYLLATNSSSGLMSSTDKTKLDGLHNNSATKTTSGMVKVYSDIADISTDKSIASNIPNLSLLSLVMNDIDSKLDNKVASTPDPNKPNQVVYSSADATKLKGVESGATKNTVLDSLTSTSITSAASANSARLLDSKITAINANIDNIAKIKNPIIIPANSNLNNYKTSGWYYCESYATATTLLNMPPLKEAFALEVISSNQVRQRWTHYNSERTFERAYYEYDNVWSEWKEVAYIENLTPASVGLDKIQNIDYVTKDSISNIEQSIIDHGESSHPHRFTTIDENGSRVTYKYGFTATDSDVIFSTEIEYIIVTEDEYISLSDNSKLQLGVTYYIESAEKLITMDDYIDLVNDGEMNPSMIHHIYKEN